MKQDQIQINSRDPEYLRITGEKQKFIEGKVISGIDFLAIVSNDGLGVSDRTERTIRERVHHVDREGFIVISRGSRRRFPKVTGCRKLIDRYLRFLKKRPA